MEKFLSCGLLSALLLLAPSGCFSPGNADADTRIGNVKRESATVAAVTVNGNKNLTFTPLFHDAAVSLEALPDVLKKKGYTKVCLSSWARNADHNGIIEYLLKEGIGVEACYVLAAGRKDWDRQNLIARETPEPSAPQAARPWLSVMTIHDNGYNRKYKLPGPLDAVEYITIHNTAEPFTARQERDRVDYRRDGKSVSFHFAVDEEEIVQILPLGMKGWHAGDGVHGPGNARSIGIEICRSQCRGVSDWRYRRSEENAVKLAAALLRHFKLPPEALRMHFNWSGKYCPHRILEEDRFETFRQRVREVLENAGNRAILIGDRFRE